MNITTNETFGVEFFGFNTTTTITTTEKVFNKDMVYVILAITLYFLIVIICFTRFLNDMRVESNPPLFVDIVIVSDTEDVVKQFVNNHKYATDEACPVCFENKNMVIMDCEHVMCDECLTNWVVEEHKNSCPICRTDII